MKRRVIFTDDGSTSIRIEDWKEQYHSTHGALQEAEHVFINAGLNWIIVKTDERPLKVLEFGLGTGLNALLTFKRSDEMGIDLAYTSLEAFPVSKEEILSMNYDDQIEFDKLKLIDIFESPWETTKNILPNIEFRKVRTKFEDFITHEQFHLVYYDAFGARVQPELWTRQIFEAIYELLLNGGSLVTYSSKGSVRRAMEEIGFNVERLQGPPGKRHMLRASKK